MNLHWPSTCSVITLRLILPIQYTNLFFSQPCTLRAISEHTEKGISARTFSVQIFHLFDRQDLVISDYIDA